MLVDRQEFDMGKAEIARIARKLLGQIAIGQPSLLPLRRHEPRWTS